MRVIERFAKRMAQNIEVSSRVDDLSEAKTTAKAISLTPEYKDKIVWVADSETDGMIVQYRNGMEVNGKKIAQRKFKYGLQYRPLLSAGNLPPGYTFNAQETSEQYPFGTIEYDKPLTSEKVHNLELIPLDYDAPSNIRIRYNKAKDIATNILLDEEKMLFVEKNGNAEFITPDMHKGAEQDAWRVTFIRQDGTPTGHIPFISLQEARDYAADRLISKEYIREGNSHIFNEMEV